MLSDFIPIYLSIAFHAFFLLLLFSFVFGGEEENWFCIPTSKEMEKTLKINSVGLEQIGTDEH